MTIASDRSQITAKPMTMAEYLRAEYLSYDDGTANRYEILDGILVDMGTENALNLSIAFVLGMALANLGIPGYLDPLPILVVEVVSPGDVGSPNYDRDYVEKPREYADRGIPEFWIIDPIRQLVLVLTLQGKQYQQQAFQGQMPIISSTFPTFNLTAEKILAAGR